MATINRYVDPDATGAGNGTSWTDAYTSLNACEAGQEQDLTDGGGDSMVIHCRSSAGTADTVAVNFSGWAADADNYITLQCDAGDGANASGWDTSRYTLEVAGTNALYLGNNADYFVLDGLQISVDPDANGEKAIRVECDVTAIKNCRIRSLDTDATYNYNNGIYLHWDGTAYVYNCIITGFLAHDDWAGAICVENASLTANIVNCTLYGNWCGVGRTNGTANVDSCAVFNNTDDFYGTIASIVKCASDDNDAESVAESGGGANWPSDFTDAANGDFTLLVNSNLVGAGTDNSAVFTTDIDGTTRSSWDIGAYEYVAAAGGANYIPAIYHYQRMRVA